MAVGFNFESEEKKMKKTNIKFIVSLCAAILVLMCTLIGISANNESGKLDVVALNVAYGDRIQLIVAVDPSGNANSDVEVTYTLNSKTYTANIHPDMTYGADSYPVFYTDGISMKDIADNVVFEAHVKNSGAIGDSRSTSVANYFYTRLYKDGIINSAENTDDYKRKTLYENCLAYGASAQDVLVNIGNAKPETLVTSYVFVWSDDANVKVDGINASSTLAPGSVITPAYAGEGTITEWTLLNVAGQVISTVNYGDEITLAEHTKLVAGTVVVPPVVEDTVTVMDYQNGASNAFVSSKDADGNAVTGTWASNSSLSMGLTTDGENTFLQVRNTANSGKVGKTEVQLSNTVQTGNCYTFETKINIKGASAGYNFAQLKFVNNNGGEAVNLFLGYATVDGKSGFAIATTGDNASVATGTKLFDATDKVITTATGWFTLKIEFYFGGVGTENAKNTFMKLYVDDILAYDGQANWAMGASISHAQIDHISAGKTHNSCYDDISFTRTDKAYKAGN